MGYVGVVSAACLARDGHSVLGVDTSAVKIDLLNQSRSPIVEPGLETLIQQGVASGRLKAILDHTSAVERSDLMMICVGTPGHANGSLDLSYVRRVCAQIGSVLAGQSEFKTVVVRSTMLPGSMESVVIPELERASGKHAGSGFGVCINPEFLREGTAIFDFEHPPKTVIGASDERAAALVKSIYAGIDAPMHVTDLRTAEMVKYVDNAWHALKVTFANEVGRLCKATRVDSRDVMTMFCTDTKLNVSAAYLRPGFAFGGSCLPKDVRALMYHGRSLDVNTPVLGSLLASNSEQIDHAFAMIMAANRPRIGLLGLSFKEGTDDLRESPIVTLAERLIGKGRELRIYDRNVKLASLVGANRDYILNLIPHISRLLVDEPSDLFTNSDIVVIATGEHYFPELVQRYATDHLVLDLVGTAARHGIALEHGKGYDGIGW
jgi:GDP-mannose 6-dehydrogenase